VVHTELFGDVSADKVHAYSLHTSTHLFPAAVVHVLMCLFLIHLLMDTPADVYSFMLTDSPTPPHPLPPFRLLWEVTNCGVMMAAVVL
jgi:hypothetical protein